MLDTTSYADKLPQSLNEVLKSFTGSECLMVRKAKEKDAIKGKAGNCHINVKRLVDKQGGKTISGWLLNRVPQLLDRGMYVWSFHSVWMKPDEKLLDVTEDKHYAGRDKSIFIPDIARVPDIEQGLSYNNFVVFTDANFAHFFGDNIGKNIASNEPYWCDRSVRLLLEMDEHSGVYRLVNADYPKNRQMMCDEYDIDIVNGRPVPRPGNKYDYADGPPIKLFFDYGVGASG